MVLHSSDNNNEKKFVLDLILGEKVEDYATMSPGNIEDMAEITDEKFDLPQDYHQKKKAAIDANQQVVCDLDAKNFAPIK